jgi:hypothetical protein
MFASKDTALNRPSPVPLRAHPRGASALTLSGATPVLVATGLSCLALRLPYVLGEPGLKFLYAALVPFLGLGLLALVSEPVRRRDSTLMLLICALTGLFALALIRTGRVGYPLDLNVALYQAVVWLTLVCFGVNCYARLGERAMPALLLSICAAPAIYVAANVLMDGAGLHAGRAAPPEAGDPATLLASLGISQTRHFFPLAAGVNNFGDVAGAAACSMAVLVARLRGAGRAWAAVALAISIYALLLTDSRAALLLALAAAAAAVLIPRAIGGGIRGWALFIPASPALLLALAGLLAGSDLIGTLARNPGDAFGSNRLLIWKPVIDLLGTFSPTQILGYGAYGQFRSGVSVQYASLFDIFYPNRYFVGAHNLALQTILDIGYVGLGVLVLAFGRALGNVARYARRASPEGIAVLAMLIYFPLIGLTESTPTVYTPEALTVFLLALCAASVMGNATARSSERPLR